MKLLYILIALQNFAICYAGVNDYEPSGDTPLIKAVYNQNIKEVEDLLNAGADPRIKKQNTEYDAYYFALNGADIEIKRRLLNWQDSDGETILIKKVWEGSVLDVAEYLRLGANPYMKKNDQANAIDMAMFGQSFLVQDLLVNYQDANGETPLIRAVFNKDVGLVKSLLAHGADLSLKKNDNASVFDFLEWMDKGNEKDVIKALLYNQLTMPTVQERNKASASLLLNMAPNEQVKFEFLNKEFESQGINNYGLSNHRVALRWLPSVPLFHSYHGGPYVSLHAKLPQDFIANIPMSIKDELIKHDIEGIDLFFVVQRFDDGYLFRPHYWLDPKAPKNFNGVLFHRYVKAGMYDPSITLEADLKDNKLDLFEFSAHDNLISPDNAKVRSVNNDDFEGFVWTLTIDNDKKDKPKRAAVTLHWFASFQKVRDLGRLITGGQIDSEEYGPKANTLNLLVEKLKTRKVFATLLPSLEVMIK